MTSLQPQIKIPCEVYSRIVGYLRPVQNWNKGKQQEFAERRPYTMNPESELKNANKDQGTDQDFHR